MRHDGHLRTRAVMLGAFGAITVLLVWLQVIAYLQGNATQGSIDLIHRDVLPSEVLVDRIAMDVERIRILVDRHIFEHRESEMDSLENQIDVIRQDYREAARRYAPIATFPGEPEAWQQLSADVAVVQVDIEPALALSRANRDIEATQVMEKLDPLFEKIDRDSRTLMAINQAAAAQAVHRATTVHERAVHTRLVFTAAILMVVVIGGFYVTRSIVAAQQQQIALNRELENRNRELDAFSGRIAHDLRGPLSTISLASELAGKSTATETIRRATKQLAMLIDDLLMLSRLGAAPRAVTQTAPVAAALKEELGRLVAGAGGTRIDLAPAKVGCGEGMLRQVLWNLGENAVKYRRQDVPPDVAVVGRVERDRYAITVSDNGLGMSPADTRHAFEPFYRSRATSSVPGTGLGLSIVRRVVEASGGTISLQSMLGVGTKLAIVLPLAS
jgi:signal transduction histidine kinase